MSLYNADQWKQPQQEPSPEAQKAEAERKARAAITSDEKDSALNEALELYEQRMKEAAAKTAYQRAEEQLNGELAVMAEELEPMLREPTLYGNAYKALSGLYEQKSDELLRLKRERAAEEQRHKAGGLKATAGLGTEYFRR